jgi:glutamate formiminotransferase
MTARLLEAVPNFSEGRDVETVGAIVRAMRATGADVLDWSADADHHRSVVTVVGEPDVVVEAAVAGARVAVERIDLRRHQGLHPRVGAVDVLPFVPLLGLTLQDARAAAQRAGERIVEELGVPVYFYGAASEPPGRTLPELRRGGYETLVEGWPTDRKADLLPAGWMHPGAHPRSGVTCVGARRLLLAWNVFVEGITREQAAEVARRIRERDGGFTGVRALALRLPSRDRVQVTMNVENVESTSAMAVFRRIEELVGASGGRIVETEIIGMLPDQLVLEAAAERLKLAPGTTGRALSPGLLRHLERGRTPTSIGE